MQEVLPGHDHGNWMMVIKTTAKAPILAAGLSSHGVDTRPMFYPLNEMPPFGDELESPVSKDLSEHCLMLPSSPTLTREDVEYVCHCIINVINATP